MRREFRQGDLLLRAIQRIRVLTRKGVNKVNYKTGGHHWVMDSGCTQHMTGDFRMFTSLEDSNGHEKITFGDNSKGKVEGLGKIAISNDKTLSNVLLVDNLSFNLLSVGQLCDLGYKCVFTKDGVVVSKIDDDEAIFTGFRYKQSLLGGFQLSRWKHAYMLIHQDFKGLVMA